MKKAHHSAYEKRTAPVLSRYGQVGLTMYCNTLDSATSMYWVGNKVISFFFHDFQSKIINTNNKH